MKLGSSEYVHQIIWGIITARIETTLRSKIIAKIYLPSSRLVKRETEAAFLRPVGMVMFLSSSWVRRAWLPFLALALREQEVTINTKRWLNAVKQGHTL